MLMLDDLLLLPVKLFLDICEKLREMADDQMLMTVDSVKRKFMEVQTEYEEGKMTEAEYQKALEFLSNRLEALRENRGERAR